MDPKALLSEYISALEGTDQTRMTNARLGLIGYAVFAVRTRVPCSRIIRILTDAALVAMIRAESVPELRWLYSFEFGQMDGLVLFLKGLKANRVALSQNVALEKPRSVEPPPRTPTTPRPTPRNAVPHLRKKSN